MECASVGAVFQPPPGLEVDDNGAAEAAEGITVAVASIGWDETIAGELLIGVLLSIAGGLIDYIGCAWQDVGKCWNSSTEAQAI